MSRSGYDDSSDYEQWSMICWRGAVESAIRGKRGQAFLKEMLTAFDKLESKRLIDGELVAKTGEACAIGTVAIMRNVDVSDIDPEDRYQVAKTFNIAPALAAEIVYMNDEAVWSQETPEQRFIRMRNWIEGQIKPKQVQP